MGNRIFDRIGREYQIEIGTVNHPLLRHLLKHLEQIAPVIGSHHDYGKVFDLVGLYQRERFGKLIDRSGPTLHDNEGVGIFYQESLAHEKVMQRDAAVEKCVRLLLEFQLYIATDGTAIDIFCSAIGRFHDAGTTAGHDGES